MDIVRTRREVLPLSPDSSRRFFTSQGTLMIMHTLDGRSLLCILALLPVILCGCLQPSTTGVAEVEIPTTLPPEPPAQGSESDGGGGITLSGLQGDRPIPFIPGGSYHEGDILLLAGTTILSPGNHILVEVSPISFGPTQKSDRAVSFGTSGVVSVGAGEVDSQNTWSFVIDTRGWKPDEYMVQVKGIEVPGYTLSSRFTLQEENSTR